MIKCLSKDVGTEKHCPEITEIFVLISIVDWAELFGGVGAMLPGAWVISEVCPCEHLTLVKMEWAAALNGFTFIVPGDFVYVFESSLMSHDLLLI